MNKKEFLGASLHTGLYVFNEKLYGCEVLKLNGLNFGDVIHKYGQSPQKCIIPIARPLSAIIKPITHNGETFVPIVELSKIGYTTYDKLIISNLKFDYRFVNLDYLPVWIYRKLIEWHFNLMDKSEPSIPVTEEFNPYK